MRTLLDRVSAHLITGLIVVNLFEAGLIMKMRTDSALYGSRTRFPMSASSLRDDPSLAREQGRCFLLRVSSDGCAFCRQDRVFYSELVKRAEVGGCRSMIVAPKAGQVKQAGVAPGTKLLQYVDMVFGNVLYPFRTPQTILLDKHGNVLWFREGALDNRSLAEGSSAIQQKH